MIPLAKKVKEAGVIGSVGDQYLAFALTATCNGNDVKRRLRLYTLLDGVVFCKIVFIYCYII